MYVHNNVLLELVRTYAYEAETKHDERDGMMCAELRSPDGRYSLNTDMETFASLAPAPEDTSGCKGQKTAA